MVPGPGAKPLSESDWQSMMDSIPLPDENELIKYSDVREYFSD